MNSMKKLSMAMAVLGLGASSSFAEIKLTDNLGVSGFLDMSANGLRVISDQEMPAGSIVRTCVQLKSTHEQFMLVSEVKWSQLHEHPGEFLLGLSLFESEDTDIQAWKEMIARRCAVE